MYFPIQQDLLLIEEASQLKYEAGDTEIERLSEVSDFNPKEQVGEDGETSTATETKAETESKVSKDAENAKDN